MVRALLPDTPKPSEFQPEYKFFNFLPYFLFFFSFCPIGLLLDPFWTPNRNFRPVLCNFGVGWGEVGWTPIGPSTVAPTPKAETHDVIRDSIGVQ